MSTPDQEIDLSGLNCPLPVLRTKQALAKAPANTTLKVIGTDPASVKEFKMFDRQTNIELVSVTEEDGKFIYLLHKS